jgi:hypothetical protein
MTVLRYVSATVAVACYAGGLVTGTAGLLCLALGATLVTGLIVSYSR